MENYIKQREEYADKAKLSNEVALLKSRYYEKDPFLYGTPDKEYIFRSVAEKVPGFFLKYIDTILVGKFDFLEEKDLDALYKDGSIYISNDKDSDLDVVDDIIHEIAHAVEENNKLLIYSDGQIEREFIAKRSRLYFLLKENGFSEEVDFYDFEKTEYDEPFDMFLYQEVSYPLLGNLVSGLFCSPYGATSLREYFANCFEFLFMENDPGYVNKVSPAVFLKIEEVLNNVN